MRKFIWILAIAGLISACGNNANNNNTQKTSEVVVEETPVISLADFDKKAGDYVNKEVKVSGIIDHVCKHGGKRLFMVSDDGDVHIDGQARFDDALTGSNVTVTGIVKELRVDEAYCLQQEEDFVQKHKEGIDADNVHEQKMKQLELYRDSMKTAGTDHLSFYSIEYVSHEINK